MKGGLKMSSDEIDELVRKHVEKTFSAAAIEYEPFLCYCIARSELVEQGVIPCSNK